MALTERISHAWNAFKSRDPTKEYKNQNDQFHIVESNAMLSHPIKRYGINTIYNPIINRIAVDVSKVKIEHAKLDENKQYKETVEDGLNYCLTTEANIDQASRAFIQDIVTSMCDEPNGVVAVCPIDTERDVENGSFDIYSMRTAKIVQWYPRHVRVRAYNDRTGREEEMVYPKSSCAIIENPFKSVMNEPNSIAQRLIRKLSLLDMIDEQSSSGKLDLIIQLPYVIKSPERRKEAEQRRKDIEKQLTGSKYGIAYTDGTEKITQLNRPIENTLNQQVEKLQNDLFNQFGLTNAILDGTADEQQLLNYQNRTIEPFVAAIVQEFRRKFLSKTARTQGHDIVYFSDPFKLVPLEKVADIMDKLTRNEIITSNEGRAILGYKPFDTPEANELRNKNLNRNDNEFIEQPYEEGFNGEEQEIPV